MEKMKECPFCGSTEELILEHPPYCYLYILYQNGLYRNYTSDEIKKAWNERYERTCHDFGGEEGTNGEGYDFACSSCGFCSDVCEPNYCPNCGAKVVD